MAFRKPVSILLPPLLNEVARLAKPRHQTTSQLVREALRRYIADAKARQAASKQEQAYGRRRAKALGIRTEGDVQRVIDEYRYCDLSRYASARRR